MKISRSKKIIMSMAALVILTAAVIITVFFIRNNRSPESSFGYYDTAVIGTDTNIHIDEFLLYAVDVKNGYEIQYGEDVWEAFTVDRNGNPESYENVAKEDILEQIRLIKALNKEAEQRNIVISDGEQKQLDENACEYYNNLAEAGALTETMTENTVKTYFTEMYLAEKVYYQLIDEYRIKNSPVNSSQPGASGGTETPVETTDTENPDAISAEDLSDEEIQAICNSITEKYFPNFNYSTDINWTLLDTVSFVGQTNGGSGDEIVADPDDIEPVY